ncbi:hypothetical protein K402DRAFT_458756 [Aulographum hederae CBS 113979]|uniref:Uncharacterized protein n=1 Tax=Aulographum hederae CBS 113979 TaxID=1176131 RepID=A0A6G1HH33_9PEZI|nr:hypothetical protein K402DRAFT_458756 [Aulographum hederae CBS 113979]
MPMALNMTPKSITTEGNRLDEIPPETLIEVLGWVDPEILQTIAEAYPAHYLGHSGINPVGFRLVQAALPKLYQEMEPSLGYLFYQKHMHINATFIAVYLSKRYAEYDPSRNWNDDTLLDTLTAVWHLFLETPKTEDALQKHLDYVTAIPVAVRSKILFLIESVATSILVEEPIEWPPMITWRHRQELEAMNVPFHLANLMAWYHIDCGMCLIGSGRDHSLMHSMRVSGRKYTPDDRMYRLASLEVQLAFETSMLHPVRNREYQFGGLWTSPDHMMNEPRSFSLNAYAYQVQIGQALGIGLPQNVSLLAEPLMRGIASGFLPFEDAAKSTGGRRVEAATWIPENIGFVVKEMPRVEYWSCWTESTEHALWGMEDWGLGHLFKES